MDIMNNRRGKYLCVMIEYKKYFKLKSIWRVMMVNQILDLERNREAKMIYNVIDKNDCLVKIEEIQKKWNMV